MSDLLLLQVFGSDIYGVWHRALKTFPNAFETPHGPCGGFGFLLSGRDRHVVSRKFVSPKFCTICFPESEQAK